MPETSAVSRTFAVEAASVPAARRFVRDAVLAAGQERWVDDALLAVSEVATNALLHAHTPFEVTVHAGADGVYVQVWDDDPTPPARRSSPVTSTTGRGLQLLSGVATAQGVQVVGPTKLVWFTLGMTRPEHADDLLVDRWRHRHDDHGDGTAAGVRTVVLLGMPLSLWLSAREHHNTLMREYSLHLQAGQSAPGRIPDDLVAADRARSLVLAALRDAPVAARVDLTLSVRPDQAVWFQALRDVLDEAERLAAAGELLASPGPGDVVAVRHWACRQVLDQLAGDGPAAWPGPASLPNTGCPAGGHGRGPHR